MTPPSDEQPPKATIVAQQLAAKFDQRGVDYAIGGAIALGFWSDPRGTLDVDLTLFLSPDEPTTCLRFLHEIGCQFDMAEAMEMLTEHAMCHVTYAGRLVDVFLPRNRFLSRVRHRRVRVSSGAQTMIVWEAEPLAVLKMLFFRPKDMLDLHQLLTDRGTELDRLWVRNQLIELCGLHDPRVKQWDDLCAKIEP